MPDIYNPNYAGNRRFQTYMSQYGATSGRVPSSRVLDDIIQSELDKAYQNMYRQKALQEQQRQFDISQQTIREGQESAEKQGYLGLGANLLTTKMMMDAWGRNNPYRNVGAVGSTQGGVTVAQPSVLSSATGAVKKGWNWLTGGPEVTPATTVPSSTYIPGDIYTGETVSAPEFSYATPLVSGAIGGLVGQTKAGRNVGEFLMGQHGGESEHGAVAGGLTGAAASYFLSGGDLFSALLGGATGGALGSNLPRKLFG